jgi:hypothetical protein
MSEEQDNYSFKEDSQENDLSISLEDEDIITAVESGESFDTIKINYSKVDWSKIKKKVKEFEESPDDGDEGSADAGKKAGAQRHQGQMA